MASGGKIRGITIELGADASKFRSELSKVNSDIRSTSSQLRDVNNLMKFEPTSAELAQQKYKLLQDQIKNTKEKLDMLKDAEAQLKSEMVNGGTEEQQKQLAALQREIVSTENRLKQLESTEGSGSATLLNLGKSFESAGAKITDIGNKLAPVSAAFAAVGAAAVAAFKRVDEGADAVVRATGATGEQADAMIASYTNVATSVKGSFDEIGSTVGNVATRFQVTGTELESLSTSFQKFASITGQDGYTAVQNISQAMRLFNVDTSQAENVMGLFAKASQDTGISVSTLESTITSSGVVLQEMGLSLSDSVNLIAQFDKEGVNASEVLGKMNKAATYFTQNGQDMGEGLRDLVNRLQDSESHTDAVAEAFEIFGKKGGNAFIKLAEQGKINLNAAGSSLSDYANIVNDTYEQTEDGVDKMAYSWKSFQTSLSGLGKSTASTVAPMLESLAGVVDDLTDGFNQMSPAGQKTTVQLGLITAAAAPTALAIGKATTAFGSLLDGMSRVTNLTNPWNAAIVAAGVALGALTLYMSNHKSESRLHLEALQKEREEVIKLEEAYKQSASSVVVSSDSQQQLKEQLLQLVDANGQVKAGEEDRANNILQRLNQQLGTQYSLTGDVISINGQAITSNQQLSDSISEVIRKKEAEALIDANKSNYATAKTEITKATLEHAKALKEEQEAYNNLSEAEKQTLNLDDKMTQFQTISQIKYKEKKDALDAATETLNKHNDAISRTEQLEKALQEGGESLKQTLENITSNVTKFTGDNVSEVEKSTQEALNSFKIVCDEYGAAGSKITEENKTTVATMAATAINELNNAHQLGVQEIMNMDQDVVTELIKMSGNMTGEAKAGTDALKAVISNSLNQIVADVQTQMPNATNIVADETNRMVTFTATNGEQMKVTMDGHLQDMNGNTYNSMAEFSAAISSGTDAAAHTANQGGQNIDSQMQSGIDSGKQGVVNSAQSVSNDAGTALQSNNGNSYSWGADMISNFSSGISSMVGSVVSKVQSLAGQIAEYLHFSVPDKGPLADADTWMPDFMQLMTEGIEKNKNKVLKQVEGLAEDMQLSMEDISVDVGMSVENIDSLSNSLANIQPSVFVQNSDDTLIAINKLSNKITEIANAIGERESTFNINLTSEMDGKVVAKQIATYTQSELEYLENLANMRKGVN